ncbi:MAG: carboxymuconolactone decarboxylase family protein [Chloroflexota bacterium]
MKRAFQRRYYDSWRQMGRELLWPLRNRRKLRRAMREELISFALRERLMLVVTAVNDCRYCAHYHTKVALRADLPETEIRQMLAGEIHQAPTEELPALLYAQAWAQQNGRFDSTAQQDLIQAYGPDKAEAMETILRLIRIGNLSGNTFDYWLYRLSFGRLGLSEQETEISRRDAEAQR